MLHGFFSQRPEFPLQWPKIEGKKMKEREEKKKERKERRKKKTVNLLVFSFCFCLGGF
jgi:uncharacterized FAD-dependent dehydrogenase